MSRSKRWSLRRPYEPEHSSNLPIGVGVRRSLTSFWLGGSDRKRHQFCESLVVNPLEGQPFRPAVSTSSFTRSAHLSSASRSRLGSRDDCTPQRRLKSPPTDGSAPSRSHAARCLSAPCPTPRCDASHESASPICRAQRQAVLS